jgi:hypothetical protein
LKVIQPKVVIIPKTRFRIFEKNHRWKDILKDASIKHDVKFIFIEQAVPQRINTKQLKPLIGESEYKSINEWIAKCRSSAKIIGHLTWLNDRWLNHSEEWMITIPSYLNEVFADHYENPTAIEMVNGEFAKSLISEKYVKSLISSSVFHAGQGIGITGNGYLNAIRSAKNSYIENGGNFSKTDRLFISIRSGMELENCAVRMIIMAQVRHSFKPQPLIHIASIINPTLNDNIVITLVGTGEIRR